jgi:hypothetical protein
MCSFYIMTSFLLHDYLPENLLPKVPLGRNHPETPPRPSLFWPVAAATTTTGSRSGHHRPQSVVVILTVHVLMYIIHFAARLLFPEAKRHPIFDNS